MYAVFLFEKDSTSRARELLEDDQVSRQSVTLRDAKALGTSLDGLLVAIEGDKTAIERFEDMARGDARRLPEDKASEILNLLRREEEDAAEGVGFLFG
jgi:rubrerythrin